MMPSHAGVGMVHQHFMLVPVFSVVENIILGSETTKGATLGYPHSQAQDPAAFT